MKNEKEFRASAEHLLEMVDACERGEISEYQLLRAWKQFMRAGADYIKRLGSASNLN